MHSKCIRPSAGSGVRFIYKAVVVNNVSLDGYVRYATQTARVNVDASSHRVVDGVSFYAHIVCASHADSGSGGITDFKILENHISAADLNEACIRSAGTVDDCGFAGIRLKCDPCAGTAARGNFYNVFVNAGTHVNFVSGACDRCRF